MIPFWIVGVFILFSGLVLLQFNLLVGILTIAGGAVTILLYITVAPKYPVTALIFLKRHGNMRIAWDKATRLQTDKNKVTFKYKFKKLKEETKAAAFNNLYPSKKGEIAVFYSPAPGEYYQAIFKEDVTKKTKRMEYVNDEGKTCTKEMIVEESSIKPIPDNLLEWMVLKQARQKQKYMQTSAWEKYYPLIVVAVLAVVIVIMVSSLFNSMEPVMDGFKDTAASFREAANSMSAAANRMAEKEEGTQPIGTSGQTLPPPPPDLG